MFVKCKLYISNIVHTAYDAALALAQQGTLEAAGIAQQAVGY